MRHDVMSANSNAGLFLKIVCLGLLGSLSVGCATERFAYRSGKRGLFDRGTAQKMDRTPAATHLKVESNHAGKEFPIQALQARASSWRWPLDHVSVTSPFGERGRSFHEGVDLAASIGTPVYASSFGKVLYSGSKLKGYGKIVILKHPNSGLISVYAHLSRPLVKTGKWVKTGQKIGLSGKTGHATGPHLHYEVRKGVMAYDPVRVLARTRASGVRIARR